MALFYPPESNANAMTASHATMTSAVTAPAVIFAFSLNVYSRIVSAKTSENESVACGRIFTHAIASGKK